MNQKLLLTFNAGSSTVKMGIFARETGGVRRIGKGVIDFRAEPLTFHLVEGPAVFDVPLVAKTDDLLHDVLEEVFDWLSEHYDLDAVSAVGHRVVHGGDLFADAVKVDDTSLAGIESLVTLAPLHQPQNLRLIRAITELKPGMPQTASFDTAFHRTLSDTVRRFAIPRAWFDKGVKRYGFHGLSYAYIAGALNRLEPQTAGGRAIVAHLGSGASLCALEHGSSRDTSMGFSTIDGVPMATRSGAIDPGVLFHLIDAHGLSVKQLEEMIYKQSGLLGLSGISADSRALLETPSKTACEAIDVFTFRIAGEVARLAASLGGLDTLVFTAGIGENQPAIRRSVVERLRFLGLQLDGEANDRNVAVISREESRVKIRVIATDEEQVIADDCLRLLG
ncbi:acetate/propionate family kinase [Rhizobium sp. 'Codium 1']|uniref:acetate/propionate family kinase n=1 Tax=Rhizobium sp. 'Codium 1' TaxID=2940484 RepID=UPI001E2C4DB1|nr:acetate/propionate family kinase [Rhizobium sp. 'Codium 1']MCC8932600.1 acetate/propionate family kinase [Rhizobium sp. 'Codium 1']